jgi:hypothetical protein
MIDYIARSAGNIIIIKTMTQLEFIREKLLTDGYITRNYCLSRFISRLGAHINRLNNSGMKIKGENLKTQNGMDYIYRLVKPEQKKLF